MVFSGWRKIGKTVCVLVAAMLILHAVLMAMVYASTPDVEQHVSIYYIKRG